MSIPCDYSRPRKRARRHEKRCRVKGVYCQITLTVGLRQKYVTLYQVSSRFMTLKEMNFENLKKKGENASYEHF